MANITDPLITGLQGSDPQNLMEYIIRQKIYDCRFWKEECFGLSVEDVLEKSAKSLTCIGGTYGSNSKPTKFLCLVLKLLQLQPSIELIEEFILQDHFKYVKALGCFYLRMTGKPVEIYELLEPNYADYSKLKCRQTSTWKLMYMDEFITELLTPSKGSGDKNSIGITLPRLPLRETLQEGGYLPDGPRPTALSEMIEEHGSLEEYLLYKVQKERSPAAIALYEKRNPSTSSSSSGKKLNTSRADDDDEKEEGVGRLRESSQEKKRKTSDEDDNDEEEEDAGLIKEGSSHKEKKDKKKKKHKSSSGSLFADKHHKKKKQRRTDDDRDGHDDERERKQQQKQQPPPPAVEGSDEYWNEQRAKLGLKPLRK